MIAIIAIIIQEVQSVAVRCPKNPSVISVSL